MIHYTESVIRNALKEVLALKYLFEATEEEYMGRHRWCSGG